MSDLILFCLCTSSLSWILVKSKLFLKARIYFTVKHAESKNPTTCSKYKLVRSIKTNTLWYIDSAMNCVGCMGVYAGLVSYLLIYLLNFDIIAFALSGSIVSLILIKQTT